jgi:hypothetical protein
VILPPLVFPAQISNLKSSGHFHDKEAILEQILKEQKKFCKFSFFVFDVEKI